MEKWENIQEGFPVWEKGIRKQMSACLSGSVYVHVWKWKEESTGKGFTGDSINTEKKDKKHLSVVQKENWNIQIDLAGW